MSDWLVDWLVDWCDVLGWGEVRCGEGRSVSLG